VVESPGNRANLAYSGCSIVALLHVPQNKDFEGDWTGARERLRLDLSWPCSERWTASPWVSKGKTRYLGRPRRLLAKPRELDRQLLPYMAQKMAGTRSRRREASN
jgi:hypothetical protein